MEIPERCQEIRAQVEEGLAAATGDEARTEILVQGLFRLGDSVFSEMGKPGRSERYLKGQGAAYDLIVFLCVPLVRRGEGTRDLVSVLVQVAEGSADPVLQSKLTGYARQLLARPAAEREEPPAENRSRRGRYLAGVAALSAGAALLLIALQEPQRTSVLSRDGGPPREGNAAAPLPAPLPSQPAPPPREGGTAGEGGAKRTPPRREKGEQVTRIRLVANQVLVPVTVKNGAESVKVTLLLDTGSTRTALNEQLAAKLGVDLTRARGSLVEVADGRVLHSKLATVDLVAVGGRGVPSFELEFFPYNGTDQGFDGFLGMDFLSRQRYQIDVENEVIRWF